MFDNRHEDFEIVTHSITMQQVAEAYGFQSNKKGFIRCPFHGNGLERTPSLKIYPGHRGFHCKGCGVGGDVIRFVELLNNLTSKEAMEELADTFKINISTNLETPSETIERAKQARLEQTQAITLEQQKLVDLRHLGNKIIALENLIKETVPYSELWQQYQNRLPILKGEWELIFNSINKNYR